MKVKISLEKCGIKDGLESYFFPKGFGSAFAQKLIDEFLEIRGIDNIADEENLRAFYEYVYGDEADWPEFVRRKFEDVLEFISSFYSLNSHNPGRLQLKAEGVSEEAPSETSHHEPAPEPRPQSQSEQLRDKGQRNGIDDKKVKSFLSELKKYRGGFGRK